MFTSKNGFVVQTLSRRDDIISIIYNLIFLVNGKIQKMKKDLEFEEQFKIMRKFKIKSSAKEYCGGKAIHLTPILEYAYQLGFKEQPNYDKLRFMLRKILLDLDQTPIYIFNWRKNAKYVFKSP